MDEIKIGELRIAFEIKGQGSPLVLLHGAISDSREWRRQLDGLSDEFTVVAWDAPGCGCSDDPPETFRLPDYADCLAAFIEEIGLVRPHVLGLSFGSGLALELYHRYPGIPRSLILASAYAGWAGSLPPEMVKERLQQGLRLSELPPERVVDAFIPTHFAKSVSNDVIEETAAIISEFHPVGMRAMVLAFAEADLRDVLPTIEVPTLLLYGEADQRSPLDVAENLHASIPASRLVIIPGVGHQSNLEAPEIFNAEVRSFLRANQN
ncbi:MAG TPA: alpha/beta hydrolase [Candidatus Methanoperedenaceae archaeon]|nr:alpha/beta hydrolase [Candidatus Methanoperedenaceae archaeon]